MRALELQSENYQPTGSISADGIKNQLGRPKLDRLTLLARESVQNSWDARLADRGVRFGVAGWELNRGQREWLQETLFKKVPPQGLTLRASLDAAKSATVLAVYDRGTKGLSGPTRADEVQNGSSANFVNLLRNVGQPPTAFRGGGTYGFGKTALFLASQVRTIIVHSQILAGKKIEQRFMAAALGSQYSTSGGIARSGKRFTGRHWWGRKEGNVVEPLLSKEAADAAKAVGLPAFAKDETGTTILLLLPDLEDRTPENALRFMGEAILRSFWPKMIDGARGGGSMAFELSWNGTKIPMPRPQDVPPLNAYVKAFANLQAKLANKPLPNPGGWLQSIDSLRPIRPLGLLSLIKFPAEPRLVASSEEEDQGPFQQKSHHTALMRGPHFVVSYLEGPTMPYDVAEYAGVFLASPDVEEVYARAEPPTHDAWVPDMLDGSTDKRLVNAGLKRIKAGMQEFAGVGSSEKTLGLSVPLGAFSDLLGGLIPAERGTGIGGAGSRDLSRGAEEERKGQQSSTRDARSVRSARVRVIESANPNSVMKGDIPVFSVLFDLEPEVRTQPFTLSAQIGVQLEDGTTEGEPPLGAEQPKVLKWENSAGKVVSRSSSLTIEVSDRGPWTVSVSLPSDAAVAVELLFEDHA